MKYRLRYSPEALDDIRELKEHITRSANKRTAARYIRRLRDFCKELEAAPHVGEHRAGLAPDQRSIGFEHRVSVVFSTAEEGIVHLVQFDYAGRESRRTY